jgi:hypothetical protein
MITQPCAPTSEVVIAATRAWIERAVIGLNLCPFAKAVYLKDQIRYAVSEAEDTTGLLVDLQRELSRLSKVPARTVDTTLLIHPRVLGAFLDYNDFMAVVNHTIEELELDGVIQVASFHPAYQFADTASDDVVNNTNRSPYPMLQLLREASMTRAVGAFHETEDIYLKNMDTMRRLGVSGWNALDVTAPDRRRPLLS